MHGRVSAIAAAKPGEIPHTPHTSRAVLPGWLVAATLLGLFAVDNLLILAFLGLSPLVVMFLIIAAVATVGLASRRWLAALPPVPVVAVVTGIVVATVLLVLGGEGRLVYANPDWQVRDVVLADLARFAWPFAYEAGSQQLFLRAPLGMYLLPSLAGTGRVAEFALLASNAFRFGLVFALAWPLFDTGRARAIAATIFVLFSGWDVLGAALYSALGENVGWAHLEPWNSGFQFSSHVTLMLWVPQHTLAGWTCALGFLLWRRGLAPIGLLAATMPLVAIWSPLAIIGALPFAAFAGIETLRKRELRLADIALALLAVAIAACALAYLQLDADRVGASIRRPNVAVFLFAALLEVLPFLYPLLRSRGQDRPVLWLLLGVLLIIPALQIGHNADLQMRGSIMPLAVLAVLFARWVDGLVDRLPSSRMALTYAAAAVAIGTVTPAFELKRIFIYPTSPTPQCSFVDVWPVQEGLKVPWTTYLARAPLSRARSAPSRCARTRPEPGNAGAGPGQVSRPSGPLRPPGRPHRAADGSAAEFSKHRLRTLNGCGPTLRITPANRLLRGFQWLTRAGCRSFRSSFLVTTRKPASIT